MNLDCRQTSIVVLDGYTLNPGDLTWKDLESLGKCAVYDRTGPKEVVPRAKDAEIVLTNKTVLSSDVIKQLPKLKYIGVLATGYNIVDIETTRARNIPVTNVPAYGTPSVAQMVFAHLLNLAQHVAHHADTVRRGRWAWRPDFCYWDTPLLELAGLTMGIIGFGRIGRATAKLAMVFGNIVIYAFGLIWLSCLIGVNAALVEGLYPFIVGDLLKIALAAILLPAGWKLLGYIGLPAKQNKQHQGG